ncbi:MAG TPA: Rho termination factor N-terminal domain-containing protein [Solirubrobacterales bacterium]|jgi:transcription termination factor Rho|nr:Rho termination factor N-terminal domain-containing protein [Solirubrobacterales bacterium]
MNKAELEKKPLSDLHSLAAEAGVEKYRMLSKSELVDRLAEGNGSGASESASDEREERGTEGGERAERPRRRRRSRRTGSPAVSDEIEEGEAPEKEAAEKPRQRRDRPEKAAEREPAPEPIAAASAPAAEPARPRRRRRRRFGRRSKQGVTLQGLLLPPEAGRQALVFAETREGCTALLRSVAADLAADSKGPDPVALLIDPSPEELADWKRDAPQAEIVSAGQPRHASDALGQAAARAGRGEDVILLVDSLTRLGEAYGDAEAAKEFFDAGRAQGSAGGGSLTVVAALERPNGD